jgi:Cys-rich protein (TIGR01571 family)
MQKFMNDSQIFSRGDVRTRYGIDGNGCTDCLAAACCMPCEITQESLEIEEEEKIRRGGR